jgi:hypothetical protein
MVKILAVYLVRIQDLFTNIWYQIMMQKTSLYMLLVSLLACQQAFAVESDYDARIRKATSMPPEWFACAVKTDCDVVPLPGNCTVSIAVSRKHLSDAKNAINAVAKVFLDEECFAPALDNTFAVCVEGQCVTKRPEGYSLP